MAGKDLVIGDLVEFHGVRILRGIVGIYTVDVLGQQNGVGVDLRRTEHRAGIRREERVAGAAAEDHDAALLQMADGTAADIGLGDAGHLNGSLHADLNAALLQTVGQSEAVDDRGKHAHLVGAGALHPVAAVLDAAPEIAAADDDAHLHTGFDALLDDVADTADHIKIQAAVGVARQGLAADFQKYAAILRLVHGEPLLYLLFVFVYSIIILPD